MTDTLDPSKLDANRGLERDGDRWMLFGLSLEPDEWLRTDAATQMALTHAWIAAAGGRPDDAAVLHGLVVGARAELRGLAAHGVLIACGAWADLGGASGHYAVALALEGAGRVRLVDEDDPGTLPRAILAAANVEVVVADATNADLSGFDSVLALYSVEPCRILCKHRAIRRAVVAPMSGTFGAIERRLVRRTGFDLKRVSVRTPFLMGEGACALASEPEETPFELRTRRAGRDAWEEEVRA